MAAIPQVSVSKCTIPSLMSKKTQSSTRCLLRKPRVPAPVRPPEMSPQPKSYTSELNPMYTFMPEESARYSPPPSVHPSIISPPPPSEMHATHHYDHHFTMSTGSNKTTQSSMLRKGDLKYILDPVYRENTSLGTYVEGRSLVKPYRPRGPPSLPVRNPKRNAPIFSVFFDEPDMDQHYYKPPEFTLQDFMIRLSEVHKVPLARVKEVMFSKNNYKKIQCILSEQITPKQTTISTVRMHPNEDFPTVQPRIPQKQLLIEMAALVKEQMSEMMDTTMKAVIRPLPKYSPSYRPGAGPHTEILLYEDTESTRGGGPLARGKLGRDGQFPDAGIMQTSNAKYFQGGKRTNSPFAVPDENLISPSELAVLDAMMNGGTALSLKANFISFLPDIQPLMKTLTYLNLSFNDFRFVPDVIFEVKQLTVLKLRNNPLADFPDEVSKLQNLKTLVISFCMLDSLPQGLFSLRKLKHLDVSYNRISSISSDIQQLQQLFSLHLEGNQLTGMPAGALRLRELQYLKVRNNFMHPLFWKENSMNEPQHLLDMAALACLQAGVSSSQQGLPEHIRLLLESPSQCDSCHGPMYGPGLHIIRPVIKIFGVKNLPFIFNCCTPSCLEKFQNANNTELIHSLLYGEMDDLGDMLPIEPADNQGDAPEE